MHLLAQAASGDTIVDIIIPFLKGMGPIGVLLLIIGYTARKIVIWGTPHVERMIAAYISRQETMEKCHKDLTEGTLKIQTDNAKNIAEIKQEMKGICRGGIS